MRIAHALSIAWLAASASVQAGKRDEPAKLGACVRQIDGLGEPTGAAFGPDGMLYVTESLAHQVSVIDSEGKTQKSFGRELLVDPRDVALGSDGRIVVSDAGLDALVVFAAGGKTSSIGKRGAGQAELNGPEGIDVWNNFVAVADSRNDRVQVFTLDAAFVFVVGGPGDGDGQLNRPSDVAFAADGTLFVADTFHQRVQQFSREGKFLRAFGSPGPNPGQFSGPTGLAVHGDFVHVVDRDNSRVQVFTKSGELSSWYGIHALRPREGNGKLHYPLRLALDAKGARAAIVEPMENRVQVLGPVDPNVEELPPLPALPPSHFGGAIDADGPLLVATEPSIPRIQLFQMVDGEPLEIGYFGTYGSRPGQVIWPGDVAIDLARRRIYVLDQGAPRLLVFEFRFDPAEELRFDLERVRFVAELDLRRASTNVDSREEPDIDPAGMWRDGDGGLCIADARTRSVFHVDAGLDWTGRSTLPESCREPVDGCAGPRGTDPKTPRVQYVVDRLGGKVFESPSGKVIAEGLSRPAGVLVTNAGALYVSEEGACALLRPGRDKPVVARGPGLGPSELARPRGLAELPGGRVVVLDWGNHRGLIFDPQDKFLRAFGSQLFIRPTLASQAAKTPEPALKIPDAPKAAAFQRLDGTKPWHTARHCASNDGDFAVFWRSTPDPIVERESFAIEVWVTALESPNVLVTDLGLALDAGMPEHGHGMNVGSKTTRAADGHFLVEGMRMHMPGRWEMYFDVVRGARTERAQVTLELE